MFQTDQIKINKFITPEWMLAHQRYFTTYDKNFARLLVGLGTVYSLQSSTLGFKGQVTLGVAFAKQVLQLTYSSKQYDSNFFKNSSQELLFTFLYKF
ncbi:MAG: hypothetical protein KBD76_11770 [Bacteriovorax sp.]|nr:hypothetical protein [Bacteriovorax sp.]